MDQVARERESGWRSASRSTAVGFARVDRAAHQGQAGRQRFAGAGQQRNRGQRRHRGTADRQQMAGRRLDGAQEILQVGHVVVEMETPGRKRHLARIDPVGHVDVAQRQQVETTSRSSTA